MVNTQLPLDVKYVLEKLIVAIHDLSLDEYVQPIALLDNSSIGQHTRHIIELFQCLINGYETGIVNYENRKRNKKIETEIDYAIECIAVIVATINISNKDLVLQTMHKGNTQGQISTNYYRELLYNFDHCIHHQAIIKIALHALNKTYVDANLGVSASTTQYRQQCAR